jgi:glycerophosphoryl diester phosphodiesterase
MTDRLLRIGHRGAPRHATENTLPSFRGALDAGLDGLETDVQRTADGTLVLHHDPVLKDGTFIAAVDDATLRDLAPDVPSLADLLPVMREYPTARLNLEVKAAAPYDDTRAADLVRELAGWPGSVLRRTWVSTFDPLLVLSLQESLTSQHLDVPLAFLASSTTALRLLPVLPIAAVHPHHALVTDERVEAWHADGLKVYTWTVNDRDLAQRLLDAGVDGIIGDVPELLLSARRT